MRKVKLFAWATTSILWSLGALILWRIWDYQRLLSDPLGSFIEFTVMFLATFYFLALFPMKRWIDRVFGLIGFTIAAGKTS